MHCIAPLFARGGRSIERLIQGDPIAWTAAGIVFAIAAGGWYLRFRRRSEPDRSQTPREIPGTNLTELFCPRCDRRVIVMPDRTCPGCNEELSPSPHSDIS